MKFCDITIAYNESSGGIRTYIDEKRRYLRERTDHDHLLIVPGAEDAMERGERSTVVSLAGPLLPGQDTYRFFARPGRIRSVLLEHRPDVVELGSYYLSPWAAFAYRQRLRAAERDCVIGCYFHTDVAEAYVAAPLRGLAHGLLDDWSEPLASLGERVAALLARGAERYIGTVFANSDIAFAPSPVQAERLRAYGVEGAQVVPLGVDLELFHPGRRSKAVRARHGAGPGTTVLFYAGRLSTEKRVLMLIEALARLPSSFAACLWITGHGPLAAEIAAAARHIPALRLLPYQRNREDFARLLASADVYVTAARTRPLRCRSSRRRRRDCRSSGSLPGLCMIGCRKAWATSVPPTIPPPWRTTSSWPQPSGRPSVRGRGRTSRRGSAGTTQSAGFLPAMRKGWPGSEAGCRRPRREGRAGRRRWLGRCRSRQ